MRHHGWYEVLYSDTWGDHLSIVLACQPYGRLRLTQRFGTCLSVTYFWRWDAALFAFDEAVDAAGHLIEALVEGYPRRLSWPPQEQE